MTCWYVLIDPRYKTIRYVGTTHHPESRLKAHIREAVKGEGKTPLILAKHAWIRELLALGLEPIFMIIQKWDGWLLDVITLEEFWIDFYLAEGADLLNTALLKGKKLAWYWEHYPRQITRKKYNYNADTKELSVAA